MLLGTSWPPSRMQCLNTSWVEPPLLFSLRFHILAVESPDLRKEHTRPLASYPRPLPAARPFPIPAALSNLKGPRAAPHPAGSGGGSASPQSAAPEPRPGLHAGGRGHTHGSRGARVPSGRPGALTPGSPAGRPYPEARRSLTGFQAQMNTSDSWPRRTVALLGGISTSPSISIGFE